MEKKVIVGQPRLLRERAAPVWQRMKKAPQSIEPDPLIVIPAVKESSKLRVAAYCRVSTDLVEQETSIEAQEQHYRDLISSNPSWELVGIFTDQGISGTTTDRPAFQELMKKCEQHKVDLILAKSISRFSRNTKDLVTSVRFLSSVNTKVYFEKENLDTSAMASEFLLTLLAAFAAEESKSISGNVKWAIRRKFAAGTFVLSRAPYGYNKLPSSEGGGYAFSPEATIVRQMFNLALSGTGTYNIAESLNNRGIPSPNGDMWTPSTVLTILHNPFYTGDLMMQKSFMDENYKQRKNKGQLDQYLDEGNHDPLVSHEEFEAVQRLITRRASNPKGPASGVGRSPLICKNCGKPLNLEKGANPFYRCKSDFHCRIRVYEDDLRAAFVTMLNKLTFSQGLEPRRRVLTVYEAVVRKEGCTDFREIHRLRDAVEGRGMSDCYGPAEEQIMSDHIEYIVVDKKRLIFHFKCGLWLDE